VDDAVDAILEGAQHPGLQGAVGAREDHLRAQRVRTRLRGARARTHAPLPCSHCAPSCPTLEDKTHPGGGQGQARPAHATNSFKLDRVLPRRLAHVVR
jgi:hypothetical protein